MEHDRKALAIDLTDEGRVRRKAEPGDVVPFGSDLTSLTFGMHVTECPFAKGDGVGVRG